MATQGEALQEHQTVNTFNFQPFGTLLQSGIQQAVQDCGQATVRKGTKLPPVFVIWVVLMSTIRRDLNGHQILNWMLSGIRWFEGWLPAASKLVSDGALTHARKRVGVEVFHRLFLLLRKQHPSVSPDFHGRTTGAFDGGTGTMPDTVSNRTTWGKPGSSRRPAAFPQMRYMGLLVVATRTLWDVAYAPYRGKGTGERALMHRILARLGDLVLLLLIDAGLYSFKMVWTLQHAGHDVIAKVPKSLKLPINTRLPDGSFLSQIMDSFEDSTASSSPTGRHTWRTETLNVRVIRGQIPGYRPWTLVTTLLDPAISALEIAQHYHRRWDIEIAYDEIKTHQCATLRGHAPTTFRSKCGELVEQEFYAMVIMYTTIRLIMAQAAKKTGVEPRDLSFLDSLQHLLDAAPFMGLHDEARQVIVFDYLLEVLATTVLDHPRRPRLYPRVVKVARSKFPRKGDADVGCLRQLENPLTILTGREEQAS